MPVSPKIVANVSLMSSRSSDSADVFDSGGADEADIDLNIFSPGVMDDFDGDFVNMDSTSDAPKGGAVGEMRGAVADDRARLGSTNRGSARETKGGSSSGKSGIVPPDDSLPGGGTCTGYIEREERS